MSLPDEHGKPPPLPDSRTCVRLANTTHSADNSAITVATPMPTTPRILMCPPDHYGIEYEINPWMNRSLGAVRGAGVPAVATAARHARVARRSGRDDDAATRPARPRLHRQRRAHVPRIDVPQQPLPARGPRQGIAALRRLVSRARLHGRAPAGGHVPRGGRRCALLRRDALRRLPHPLRRRRAPVGRQNDSASACCRSNSSTRASTTSTPASARSRRARRSTSPTPSTPTASACSRRTSRNSSR